MNLLLDTCVLSECFHPNGASSVKSFVDSANDSSLYMSVITLGELTKGIALLPEGKKKSTLLSWLAQTQSTYHKRILPIEPETALIWGEITSRAQQHGKTLAAADGLIAATALHQGLHLVTRNVKDFETTGTMLINPWQHH